MYRENTNILYAGTDCTNMALNPETPPIYQTTAYIVEDTQDYEFANGGGKYFYHRTGNPNRDGIGEVISFLENGEQTILCSSGMGAISTTLFGILKKGEHAVFSKDIYGETLELIPMLKGFGIEVTLVDFTNLSQVESAIKESTKLFYTEVIANPLTQVVDIEKVSAIAHKRDILVVVDSTFTTPFVIKPIDFGVDIVIHSLTKFFGGHSDVSGGSITSTKKIIARLKLPHLLLGSALDGNSAWLLQRSAKTMAMRLNVQLRNAEILAKSLAEEPKVKAVHHPSLETHPQHELAKKIFLKGYGAVLSFRIEDDIEKINKFIRKLEIVKYVGTLGGLRTTLVHPATAFRNEFSPEKLREMGMEEGLIRVSVGAEDVEDLILDIKQALEVL